MAVVKPFHALRYDPARVGDLGAVVAPPYDVISPAQQDALYARSPWNVVRLILPREPERADAAAATLRDWLRSGVLARDAEPALYFYSQEFSLPDGSRHRARRRALPARPRGVLDRRRAPARANVSGPEEGPAGAPARHRGVPEPDLRPLRAAGRAAARRRRASRGRRWSRSPTSAASVQRVWRVTDPATIARVSATLAPETIFIADGHHRYETGLAYRRERGAAGPDSILAFVSNMEEEGLVVLPTHRLLRVPLRLEPAAFEARAAGVVRRPAARTRARPGRTVSIDVILPDRQLRLRPLDAARARVADLPAERARARRRGAARRAPRADPRRRAGAARVHARRRARRSMPSRRAAARRRSC